MHVMVFGGLVGCLVLALAAAPAEAGAVRVGDNLPAATLADWEGTAVQLAAPPAGVMVIDFWASWCGPCVAELPNVLKTYEKHHGKGFEIIGVSLDQDENRLTTFTKQKNMAWQQFFDGKGWGNKLAVQYGINSIPATFLLDGDGKIIARDLRGEKLEDASIV